MDVEVTDLEPMPAHVGPWDVIRTGRLEINDLLATHADEVMMPNDLRVESACRARMADPRDHAQFNEIVQDAVDGRSRNGGQPLASLLADLVGGRMIVPANDQLEYRPPLHGQRNAVVAAEALEVLDRWPARGMGHDIAPSAYCAI